jgi:hypothetical protein
MEGHGERVSFAVLKRKSPSCEKARASLQHALREASEMQSERLPFEGILTNDDHTLAHRDCLLFRRLSLTFFKPPFGSHGADRLRSERQAPWFLRAQ